MADNINYDIDYKDERFQNIESDKKQALSEVEATYGGMIDNAGQYYDKLAQNTENWGNKQAEIQKQQTDFAIEQIEQQKQDAQKEYTKEQQGAYADWKKQSNRYGASAEQMAASGLSKSGYSESSQVSMYNTYQNRIATARESYSNAITQYNIAIKDAQMQNNAVLAEIAYNTLQKQLELSLEGFQYKNQLILDKASRKAELDQIYYNRRQDVLSQINTENAMKEQVRQYNESLREQARQHNEEMNYKYSALKAAELEETIKKYEEIIKAYEDSMTVGDDTAANTTNNEKDGYYDDGLRYGPFLPEGYSNESSSKDTKSNRTNTLSSKTNKGGNGGKFETNTIDYSTKTINKKSLNDLGYGSISEQKLAELINSGEVIMYPVGDQIYFRKISNIK